MIGFVDNPTYTAQAQGMTLNTLDNYALSVNGPSTLNLISIGNALKISHFAGSILGDFSIPSIFTIIIAAAIVCPWYDFKHLERQRKGGQPRQVERDQRDFVV